MQETLATLANVALELEKVKAKVDLPALERRVAEIKTRLTDETVWQDRELSQDLQRNLVQAEKLWTTWSALYADLANLQELSTMIHEGDSAIEDFKRSVRELVSNFEQASVQLYLNGPYDDHHAFFEIHAGLGGEDAEDFVAMLLRMYLRYFERRGYETSILEENQSEAGYKRVVLDVRGDYAFGYLKSEKGVHRLIRLSPFKSNDSRQTSFALVHVLPMVQHENIGKINSEDLRVDAFRSSGAGGQKVNKTSSAIRITHLPTGIVVTCQTERSQAQNKEQAMNMLYAKLLEKQEQEKNKLEKNLRGDFVAAEWGNQIRTYTLHPYKLVKDHRTNVESSQVDKVLDGEIDLFVESYLLRK